MKERVIRDKVESNLRAAGYAAYSQLLHIVNWSCDSFIMQSTSPSPLPNNRGSRSQRHPEQPPTSDNPYRQAPLTPFPQYDHLVPRPVNQHDFPQHDFPTPTFQRQRAVSSYELDSGTVMFPEPQLYRAGSAKAIYRPLTPTNQDVRNNLGRPPRLSPALPPALPLRNSVASPKPDRQVASKSFTYLAVDPYPTFDSALGFKDLSRSQ